VHIGSLGIEIRGNDVTIYDGGGHKNFDPSAKVVPPHLELVRVKDRDRATTYDPPSEHLGQKFTQGREPIAVAEAALAYAEGLLEEAGDF
jgi:hypothetical protein